MQKETLRKTLFAKRQYADIHSAVLTKKIYHCLQHYAPKCIGFYWPLKGEFEIRSVIVNWLALNDNCLAALPIIEETHKILHFHQWQPDTFMITGSHNIAIPANSNHVQPDLLLIPCLGFNRENYRLGYGGGYYDRTLAHLSVKPITIGIAFETCVIDHFPREPHDLPLDAIMTDHC